MGSISVLSMQVCPVTPQTLDLLDNWIQPLKSEDSCFIVAWRLLVYPVGPCYLSCHTLTVLHPRSLHLVFMHVTTIG